MKSPIVVYLGPSLLDGAPIVALASLGSSNVKTGPMVQTWILRADMDPMMASRAGLDESVCGTCPRRHSLGGDCYVTLFQAPLVVWRHWDRSGRPGENWTDEGALLPLTDAAREHGLRLGSYGDPGAVPWHVWADLIDALAPRMHTGYTHQWRSAAMRAAPTHYAWCRDNLMASCDTQADAALAREVGWRYFLALTPAHLAALGVPDGTVQCPADRTDNARRCEECGACNGAQARPGRVSIYLVEHGARSERKHRRATGLRVVA